MTSAVAFAFFWILTVKPCSFSSDTTREVSATAEQSATRRAEGGGEAVIISAKGERAGAAAAGAAAAAHSHRKGMWGCGHSCG